MSIGKENEVSLEDAEIRALVAHNLRNIRKKRNISQYDLENLTGLHRNFISDVERGQRNLTLSNIGKLARGIGVAPMELFRPVDESENDLPEEIPASRRREHD